MRQKSSSRKEVVRKNRKPSSVKERRRHPNSSTSNKKRKHLTKKSHKPSQKFLKRKKQAKVKRLLIELALSIIFGLFLFFVTTQFFFKVVDVNGYGMMPTLRENDVVLVQRYNNIKRFDLVAFKYGNDIQVRRVIGLPGEQIRYENDHLFVKDEPIDEKFIVDEINESQRNGRDFTENFPSAEGKIVKIPKDYYFILGDNRPYATDSRIYGVVSKDSIIGIVKMQLFPINEWKSF
ncbi:signal peptidase I [Enterococcus rivorum]|uniref:Signal peptidase I n=1 Tax=Enterococcus rivorum TaxID=762845 RepID=A0A1E5KY95_9ENTE|nr:signal peptidase I [Enterococcus rivorum]MBP2099963.1 signal peptidase I [Enterococcus rivorum]OEH82826.1 signal peptidase I [Enterococcus rivorum]